MRALGTGVTSPYRVYLVGGATAVLLGWRDSTIDVDLKIIPESDEVFRSLPPLKERFQMNIELGSGCSNCSLLSKASFIAIRP